MDIKELKKYMEKPTIYTKGNSNMWTDPYINKHLLKAHLNQDVDAASRSFKDIDQTVSWLSDLLDSKEARILDLGCGPGLYTERLAKKGYHVKGIDFSENSIEYAKEQAKKNNLEIDYQIGNYLSFEFKEKYDLIYIIFCDLGVLSFSERRIMISNIYNALKSGGLFVFDAYSESFIKNKTFGKDYEYEENEFWSQSPALCLSQSFHYKESKTILDQHIVITEDSKPKVYRFYNQYMNFKDVNQYFLQFGFSKIEEHTNIVNDSTINFYVMHK